MVVVHLSFGANSALDEIWHMERPIPFRVVQVQRATPNRPFISAIQKLVELSQREIAGDAAKRISCAHDQNIEPSFCIVQVILRE